MAYEIEISDLAIKELKSIRANDRRLVFDQISKQLKHRPTTKTRNRKCLSGVTPDFDHLSPVWELRVGKYRIFYDVDEEGSAVYVRAVRVKGKGQTTEDIIHEENNP